MFMDKKTMSLINGVTCPIEGPSSLKFHSQFLLQTNERASTNKYLYKYFTARN